VCAEECGFEAMAFPDHVVHPDGSTRLSLHADGSRRWQAFTPWVDPWVAIAACAAVTTRLRFTNNVFVLAMRNPFLAAKAIATAAVLSRGRVTLTLGSGGRTSSTRCSARTSHARPRTDEMIEVLRKLWTGEMVEHEGTFYRFDSLESNPRPPAPIPIWVGGISDAALRRAARNDGWLSDLQSTSEIERASTRCAATARSRAARASRST
jgi:probable F420-dependent oxidoreductase